MCYNDISRKSKRKIWNVNEMDKRELRKEILARRNALSQQECQEKSKVIVAEVIELEMFKKSNKVLLYAPIRNEVETKEICCEAKWLQKEVYYPRVMGTEMKFYRVDETTEYEISKYGIREPKPESTVSFEPMQDDVILVIMPGAVFDRDGNRIGYGGGYYDKFLSWLEAKVSYEQMYKIAVAYECQIVALGVIEKEEHDVIADCIITEGTN